MSSAGPGATKTYSLRQAHFNTGSSESAEVRESDLSAAGIPPARAPAGSLPQAPARWLPSVPRRYLLRDHIPRTARVHEHHAGLVAYDARRVRRLVRQSEEGSRAQHVLLTVDREGER